MAAGACDFEQPAHFIPAVLEMKDFTVQAKVALCFFGDHLFDRHGRSLRRSFCSSCDILCEREKNVRK